MTIDNTGPAHGFLRRTFLNPCASAKTKDAPFDMMALNMDAICPAFETFVETLSGA